MKALELKVPPPAVALIIAVLMWLMARALPALDFEFAPGSLIGSVLALTGIATAVAGVVTFARAKTTVNPTTPQAATSLVSSGIYRMTRNPMYLGLLLILTAWALYLSNVLPFLLLPVFILYLNHFQIAPEERALASLFGREFAAYRSRVRRWI
ncbi:MAG: isoprenylcysteine carboxylmethyltransferase family protein [Acidobacteriota bacterium]|nr:isoprenylcysteine carboxylmethyltransferase family protein [Acidobacteriota bacterium]